MQIRHACKEVSHWLLTGMLAGFFCATDSFSLLRKLFKEVFVDS